MRNLLHQCFPSNNECMQMKKIQASSFSGKEIYSYLSLLNRMDLSQVEKIRRQIMLIALPSFPIYFFHPIMTFCELPKLFAAHQTDVSCMKNFKRKTNSDEKVLEAFQKFTDYARQGEEALP